MLSRLLGAIVLLGAAFAVPISPASASSSHNENLAAIIVADHNEVRIAAGLEPLSMMSSLASFADANSNKMASSGSLTQTDLSQVMNQYPSASWAGENTGVMFESADQATDIWLGSSAHAAILLAPYATHVFASVRCSADGRLWASVILVEDVAAPRVAPPAPTSVSPADSRCARPVEPFRSSPDFVAQQYRDFLGREPDQSGIDYWVIEMENGRITPTQLMTAFMNGEEFGGRVAPVVRVHIAATGQMPTAAALRSGLDAVGDGASFTEMADLLLGSPAGLATYGDVDDETFVIQLFNRLFDRPASSTELSQWTAGLGSGLSRGHVVSYLANDAEYREASYADVQVYMAYAAMLLRAPDAEGLSYWSAIVDQGGSMGALLDGFINSSEYRNRF